MSLSKLKSVFSDIREPSSRSIIGMDSNLNDNVGSFNSPQANDFIYNYDFTNPTIGGLHESEYSEQISKIENTFGEIGGPFDFFDGQSNSYFPALETPIEGFTNNFNIGGYSIPDGELGNSHFIGIDSNLDNVILFNNEPKLGISDGFMGPQSKGVSLEDSIRAGLDIARGISKLPIIGDAFTGANIIAGDNFDKLIGVADAGFQIVDVVRKNPFGLDGINNVFGPISLTGEVQGGSRTRYEKTVFELTNGGLVGKSNTMPTDSDASSLKSTNESFGISKFDNQYRGVAFQVLGDINKLGNVPDFSYQDSVVGPDYNAISLISNFVKSVDIDIGIKDSVKNFGANTADKVTGWFDGGGDSKSENEDSGVEEGFGTGFKMPSFLTSIGSGISNFAGGALDVAGSVVGGVADVAGSVAGGVAGAAGSIASAAGNVIGAVNPFDIDIGFDMDFFKDPFGVNSGPNGGQAQFKKNQPRALSFTYTKKLLSPGEQLAAKESIFSLGATMPDLDPGSETKKMDRLYGTNIPTTPFSQLGKVKYLGDAKVLTKFYPDKLQGKKGGGDPLTISPIASGNSLDVAEVDGIKNVYKAGTGDSNYIESVDNGMPFYFKDLRSSSYIVFRAYISSLTENVAPNWNEENYVGRSEPVYIYGNVSRDISFDLKLFAGTPKELNSIYRKMDRLNSLCYPTYKTGGGLSQNRMQPPVVGMRIGELFGSDKKNQIGHIKSLTYTYDDNSPWEFRRGQRVPKLVTVSIGFQVMHVTVPSTSTSFYGYADPGDPELKVLSGFDDFAMDDPFENLSSNAGDGLIG